MIGANADPRKIQLKNRNNFRWLIIASAESKFGASSHRLCSAGGRSCTGNVNNPHVSLSRKLSLAGLQASGTVPLKTRAVTYNGITPIIFRERRPAISPKAHPRDNSSCAAVGRRSITVGRSVYIALSLAHTILHRFPILLNDDTRLSRWAQLGIPR